MRCVLPHCIQDRQSTSLGNDCGTVQEAARPLQPENPSFAFHPGPISDPSDSARTVRVGLHAGFVLRVPDATFPVAAGFDRPFNRRLRVSVFERCVQQHGRTTLCDSRGSLLRHRKAPSTNGVEQPMRPCPVPAQSVPDLLEVPAVHG